MNLGQNIVKYRYGLIVTTAVHLLAFFYLSTTTIQDYKMIQPNEDILAEFDFTDEEPQYASNADYQAKELVNASSNASQEKSTYTNSFDKSGMDQSIEDEMKDLENQFFDELKEGRDDVKEIKETKTTNSSVLDENTEQNDNASLGADVSATASFILKGRYDLELPAPSYICRKEGVVVVNIKVSQKGNVKTVSVNTSGTNTNNECLINEALSYAKKARFNQDFNANSSQSGTIQFVFSRQ